MARPKCSLVTTSTTNKRSTISSSVRLAIPIHLLRSLITLSRKQLRREIGKPELTLPSAVLTSSL